MSKVQQLRECIQCGTYTVDSQAVAAAILKRLLLAEEETHESLAELTARGAIGLLVLKAPPGVSVWRGSSPHEARRALDHLADPRDTRQTGAGDAQLVILAAGGGELDRVHSQLAGHVGHPVRERER